VFYHIIKYKYDLGAYELKQECYTHPSEYGYFILR